MRITLKELRHRIRHALHEKGGGNAMTPHIRDALSPALSDREELGRMTLKDLDGNEEIASHLRDQSIEASVADDFGPVPPKQGNDVTALTDPYTRDYGVLPISSIRK